MEFLIKLVGVNVASGENCIPRDVQYETRDRIQICVKLQYITLMSRGRPDVITRASGPDSITEAPEAHRSSNKIDLPYRLTIRVVFGRDTKASCASTTTVRNIGNDETAAPDWRKPTNPQNTKSPPQKAKAEFRETF